MPALQSRNLLPHRTAQVSLVHCPKPLAITHNQPYITTRRELRLQATGGTDKADVASLQDAVGAAWDPEGLLPPLQTGLIERRQRIKSGASRNPMPPEAPPSPAATPAASSPPPPASAPVPPSSSARAHAPAISVTVEVPKHIRQGERSVKPISVEALAAGGVLPSELSAVERAEFEHFLARHYMTVDLNHPGLRVLSFDPPIFTVENFLPDAACENLIAAAAATGLMQPSKIGGGNVKAAGASNQYSSHRTSINMLCDNAALAAHPRLERVISDIQSRGRVLLQAKKWRAWGKPGMLPAPGQYTYESSQVTRYDSGQHFLAHEDGFLGPLAQTNGFQRAATLLLYLNDVPEGGRTRFNHLGLAVQPSRGRLVVFFPGQADGSADSRTLHTAEDAVDTVKHVMQQWVACGYGALPAAAAAAAAKEAAGYDPAAAAAAAAATASSTSTPSVISIPVPVKSSAAKKPAKGTDTSKGFSKKR